MQMMRIKEASKNNKFRHTWSRRLSPAKRLKMLNKQFAKLDLKDYLCEYTDLSARCAYSKPTEAQLNAIFNDTVLSETESIRDNLNELAAGE